MLIEDSTLNIKEFKTFFNRLDWVRVPRTLTQDHADYFYVGTYEDKDLRVKATIRPSLHMQLFETSKNLTLDGKKPKITNDRTKLVDWSSSVEVKVDDSFIEKVKSVAKEQELNPPQTITWS